MEANNCFEFCDVKLMHKDIDLIAECLDVSTFNIIDDLSTYLDFVKSLLDDYNSLMEEDKYQLDYLLSEEIPSCFKKVSDMLDCMSRISPNNNNKKYIDSLKDTSKVYAKLVTKAKNIKEQN